MKADRATGEMGVGQRAGTRLLAHTHFSRILQGKTVKSAAWLSSNVLPGQCDDDLVIVALHRFSDRLYNAGTMKAAALPQKLNASL